ncbi:hypothetical protein Q9R29_16445 [Rothia sp. ARF10]|nr:hypothetical protein [Rothia sp. ARF10]
MSDRAPFFEPPRPPVDEPGEPGRFVNHPWMPPINVVPAVVALNLDVVETDLVVMRVAEIRVFDRGMLVETEAWVHPESAARAYGAYGMSEEPRVGLLLEDGTKLGAGEPGTSPGLPPDAPSTLTEPMFVQHGGASGELRVGQSWWISPMPDGDAEVVLAWEALGIPETYATLDLAVVREAASRARELWPLPDAGDEEFGWFAYAPGGGTAYPSSGTPATGGEG